ncbi:MAG: GNAT family N-acetyltransferase [Verrucomicrobiota bacterium]
MSSLTLKSPETEAEWIAYHKIRRSILWEARGIFGVYSPAHPDEYEEENFPKLLIKDSEPVGVIRIDLDTSTHSAGFRRVAIIEEKQRKGLGSALMQLSEEFALTHGCDFFHANVSIDAIGFYEKIGYKLDPTHPSNNPNGPRMTKSASSKF